MAGFAPVFLRDDVGNQQTLDSGELILDLQFPFFQSLHLKLIERDGFGQPCDNIVEIPMLGLQFLQLAPEFFLIDRVVHCANEPFGCGVVDE